MPIYRVSFRGSYLIEAADQREAEMLSETGVENPEDQVYADIDILDVQLMLEIPK